VHPEYCLPEDCDTDAYDFGYVVLAEPVQGVQAIPPLVDQGEWDELMTVDHELLLVGFGATRDSEEDESSPPLKMDEVGYKRSVTTVLTGLSKTGLELFAGEEGRDTCFGDSGGPVFAQLASGEWRLVGITSRGVSPCGSGRGIYGVPYAALPWIAEETGVELLPASCAAGDCLDIAPPEEKGRCSVVGADGGDTPLLGLGLLGLVVLGRRRRSA
jgi:MYXO-CTERM domain-containing protein